MDRMSQNQTPSRAEAIALKNPVPLATYQRYTDAQRAVDYLSDEQFPVENCMIVGTDLRQLERVTGRMTQQKAALGGLLSGAWFGLFIGLIMSMFDGQTTRTVITTMLFGALFGLVWALITYAMTRGQRDFTSVTSVVATRYEVLVEHGLLMRAREVLSGLPNNGLPTGTGRPEQPSSVAQPPTGSAPSSPQPPAPQGPPVSTAPADQPPAPQSPAPQGSVAEGTGATSSRWHPPAPEADETQRIEQRPPWEQPRD